MERYSELKNMEGEHPVIKFGESGEYMECARCGTFIDQDADVCLICGILITEPMADDLR